MWGTNVSVGGKRTSSTWRKISTASWRPSEDSTITVVLELPVSDVKKFLKNESLSSGTRITLTHYVGWVLGKVMGLYPEMNVLVRRDQIFFRKEVNFSFLVASGRANHDSEDLTGVLVRNIDQKSLAEIATVLDGQARAVRDVESEESEPFAGLKGIVAKLPWPLMRYGLRLTGFILFQLNLWRRFFGLEKDAFGSCMITSVGMLGLKLALPRIYPFSGNVLMVCVGAVHEKALVISGKVEVGEVINVAIAADHRVVDGYGGAQILRTFESLFLSMGDLNKLEPVRKEIAK